MYQRSIVRLLTTSGYYQDARVATFNVGSGAYQCLVTGATTTASGTAYEVHTMLPPDEKERCIDATVRNLREEKELPSTRWPISTSTRSAWKCWTYRTCGTSPTRWRVGARGGEVVEARHDGDGQELRIEPR